jgi:hypothetical protein
MLGDLLASLAKIIERKVFDATAHDSNRLTEVETISP